MLLVTTQGCVLGSRPTARHAAMAIDGAMVVGGIVIAATANRSSQEFVQGVVDDVGNTLQKDVGVGVLLAGLVGLAINAAVTPKEPAPAVRHLPPASGPTVSVAPSAGLSLSALTLAP
jgi:drug/metabolite transporter (DMT)-like permease